MTKRVILRLPTAEWIPPMLANRPLTAQGWSETITVMEMAI
jgi:hypothetical protein